MTDTPSRAVLIAAWTLDQDPTIDHPKTVRWADGDSADFDDYLAHSMSTHTFVVGGNGIELHMYPAVVGDVRYDPSVRRWVMIVGVGPIVVLDLDDEDAPDDQIMAELFTYPVVYRARIHR